MGVSNAGVTETEKTLVVLRDMGAVQTVLLKDVLPLLNDTYMHKHVLVVCIGYTGYQSLLLHRVCMK